jgi:stage III sporulation protein AA
MSARAVFVDEIATEEEASAILSAMGAGISVVATCHGASAEDLCSRKCLAPLILGGMFKSALILSRRQEGLSFLEASLSRVAV